MLQDRGVAGVGVEGKTGFESVVRVCVSGGSWLCGCVLRAFALTHFPNFPLCQCSLVHFFSPLLPHPLPPRIPPTTHTTHTHPPGGEGRTSGGRPSVTPWGRPAKGKPTRRQKHSDFRQIKARPLSKMRGGKKKKR